MSHQLTSKSKFFPLDFSALLRDVEAHYQDPTRPYPKEENPLMFELTSYLEWGGIHNPLTKVLSRVLFYCYLSLLGFAVLVYVMPFSCRPDFFQWFKRSWLDQQYGSKRMERLLLFNETSEIRLTF